MAFNGVQSPHPAKEAPHAQLVTWPSLPKMSQMSYNNETWHSYTLPKEEPKNI